MGRHRAPDKSTPTATDLIAQIAEEDARPPEPVTAEIELVFDGDPPTRTPLRGDGVVPVHIHWLADAETEHRDAGGLQLPTPVAEPRTDEMLALPPAYPPAVRPLSAPRSPAIRSTG